MISIVTGKIRFINVRLIPFDILLSAEKLTIDIDVDDTEFIGLTEHINGKFWSGDKELKNGLLKKNWNKFISTEELYHKIGSRK
jgi:predicted nucleic acid-binding protein